MRLFMLAICLVILTPVCTLAAPDGEAETLEWRAKRDASLRQPDGWLSLIGLHWLDQGRNSVGSASDNDVVLNAGPDRVGVITVAHGEVEFCPASDAITVAGESVKCARLASDAQENKSVVRFGSIMFYLIDREGELALRVKDSQAGILQDFEGMEYFPYDPEWRIEARFEAHEPGRIMEIPNVLGSVERSPNPGRVIFEKNGEEHVLEAVRYEGDDELFLVFADRSNGKSTYGAGRFLYTPLPDENGRLIVDFNQSYNPPCVFTPYATCPLPPPGNRLDLNIEAGEKNYAEGVH